jgi:hypothetical protein
LGLLKAVQTKQVDAINAQALELKLPAISW